MAPPGERMRAGSPDVGARGSWGPPLDAEDMDHSRGHALREQESTRGAQLRDQRPGRTKQKILWGTEALKETRWPGLAGRSFPGAEPLRWSLLLSKLPWTHRRRAPHDTACLHQGRGWCWSSTGAQGLMEGRGTSPAFWRVESGSALCNPTGRERKERARVGVQKPTASSSLAGTPRRLLPCNGGTSLCLRSRQGTRQVPGQLQPIIWPDQGTESCP